MPQKKATPSSTELLTALQSLPDSIMIALSGGIDSVSLLHALVQIGKKPAILHFNHGWRKESVAEAQWVKALAASYNLPLYLGKAPKSTPHTETAAREARDRFFITTAQKLKCHHLLLAHHADDQIETFLLQLFRGTGSGGFGMRKVSERGGLTRLRPWLGFWKKEIESYARDHQLIWKEDPSNLDLHHHRNWIRHELLPLLSAKLNRDLPTILLRTASLLRDQTLALQNKIDPLALHERISLTTISSLSLAEQRLTIKRWLENHSIPDLSAERIEAIVMMITQAKPAKINLPRGDFARRTRGEIWIERGEKKPLSAVKKTRRQAL